MIFLALVPKADTVHQVPQSLHNQTSVVRECGSPASPQHQARAVLKFKSVSDFSLLGVMLFSGDGQEGEQELVVSQNNCIYQPYYSPREGGNSVSHKL